VIGYDYSGADTFEDVVEVIGKPFSLLKRFAQKIVDPGKSGIFVVDLRFEFCIGIANHLGQSAHIGEGLGELFEFLQFSFFFFHYR